MSCDSCIEPVALKCVEDEDGKSLSDILSEFNEIIKKVESDGKIEISSKEFETDTIQNLLQDLVFTVEKLMKPKPEFNESKFLDFKLEVEMRLIKLESQVRTILSNKYL